MHTYFLNNLSLSLVMLVFLSLPAFAEHPSEHPSEHPEHPKKTAEKADEKKPVTKADIAKGIKAHIKSATKEGGGKYKLNHEGAELSLKLEKVHKDKLAQLDNGLFFACTDFQGSDGNTYDVDFFLGGSAGDMEVTDAAVHKINGVPLYTWRQKSDGKWVKDPVAR